MFDTLRLADSNGTIIPDGYGTVIQVPAYPLEIGADVYELTFDGDNDYVDLGDVAISSSMSLSMWINPDDTTDGQCFFGKNTSSGGNIFLFGYWGGGYEVEFNGITNLATGQKISGHLAHIVLTVEDLGDGSSVLTLYRAGILLDTKTSTNTITDATGTTQLGMEYDSSTKTDYLKGVIKNVALYNRVITEEEVATLYNGGEVSTGLTNSWAINESTGSTIYDSVGSNDGTIYGASWVLFSGVRFKWGTSVTSITQVYVEQDDKITSVSHSGFTNSGLFLLSDADAYQDGDNTKGLRKVYVTGVMRNLTNPADIIVDLNARLANIQYNSTNYNLTEWESEKTALAGVSLYMKDSKSLYDWISLLQSGSTWGFRYEDTGKRTIRRDDPDRATITFDDGTTLITPLRFISNPIDPGPNSTQPLALSSTATIIEPPYYR